MLETIQTVGPYVLAFWFGAAFGFVVCAFFAGSRILERQAITSMIYGTMLPLWQRLCRWSRIIHRRLPL